MNNGTIRLNEEQNALHEAGHVVFAKLFDGKINGDVFHVGPVKQVTINNESARIRDPLSRGGVSLGKNYTPYWTIRDLDAFICVWFGGLLAVCGSQKKVSAMTSLFNAEKNEYSGDREAVMYYWNLISCSLRNSIQSEYISNCIYHLNVIFKHQDIIDAITVIKNSILARENRTLEYKMINDIFDTLSLSNRVNEMQEMFIDARKDQFKSPENYKTEVKEVPDDKWYSQ